MKKPKANITILVIFMLITASVIGLLVMWYVRNMLTFSNNFFSYNKAYYLAEGWIELQLTKAQQRGIGYQDDVDLSEYYPCIAGNKWVAQWSSLCQSTAGLVAQGDLLTRSFDALSCSEATAYSIQWGDAIGFPLFVEDAPSNIFDEQKNYTDLFDSFSMDIEVPNSSSDKKLGFGIVKLVQDSQWQRDLPQEGWFSRVIDGPYDNQSLTKADFPFNADDIGPGLYYFVVFNPQASTETDQEELQFCLSSPKDIALTQLWARSFATFRGVSVWLEARRTIELPWFVFSTVIEGR